MSKGKSSRKWSAVTNLAPWVLSNPCFGIILYILSLSILLNLSRLHSALPRNCCTTVSVRSLVKQSKDCFELVRSSKFQVVRVSKFLSKNNVSFISLMVTRLVSDLSLSLPLSLQIVNRHHVHIPPSHHVSIYVCTSCASAQVIRAFEHRFAWCQKSAAA